MGVLSDIYISRDNDEAVEYDAAPNKFSERAQFTGLLPPELSTLWAIVRGIDYDFKMFCDFPCLLEKDGGERLIHSFPAAMVTALGQLTPDQIQAATVKWAATEELSCSPADIQPVVEAMVRLARLATTSGRNLYLWNCV
jgi:hypothetical protein